VLLDLTLLTVNSANLALHLPSPLDLDLPIAILALVVSRPIL